MKYTLFLLLITSTATAQITPAQFRKSLDSVAALSRTADSRQDTRLTALERSVVTLRPGTVDSLNRISNLLTDLSGRIAQQGASLSTLNATLAGNLTDDRVQAAAIKTAQDAVNSVTASLEALKQYLKALP